MRFDWDAAGISAVAWFGGTAVIGVSLVAYLDLVRGCSVETIEPIVGWIIISSMSGSFSAGLVGGFLGGFRR